MSSIISPFSKISKDITINEREEATLAFWKKNKIFEKVEKLTENGQAFVFYEGPPTANGKPGVHHVLSRVYKDVYIRFYTQRGYHVPRKAGWDCHGLPVEREIEKSLGIKNKSEIEKKHGVAHFNTLCRKSVLQYIKDWDSFSERMAFFVDLSNPYHTMDNDYIEATWSVLKTIWDKKLIYQGYRVVPYDPVLGTTMSDAEVDLGYREVEDSSLTVRFPLENDNPFGENSYILVWTTTPWTLPSNAALALAPKEKYAVLEGQRINGNKSITEKLICAEARLPELLDDGQKEQYNVVRTILGKDLLGLRYKKLFSFLKLTAPASIKNIEKKSENKHEGRNGWYIIEGDFVSMESGTGIVHIAPAYGADDLNLGEKHHLPLLHGVGLDGKFFQNTPYAGLFFKEADPKIIHDLKKRNLVWKSEKYKHKYPFGYRTGAPLLYYAKDAWYIRTTNLKDQLLKNNQEIRWVPEHIKNGRFGNWLENNRDWALSRERYWGTPLPIWTDGDKTFRLIASVKELEELCGRKLDNLDLHRPHIDKIEFHDPQNGKLMKRIPEVIDCWFDSGVMPYAQWSSEKEKEIAMKRYFPADFISEAIDQTRGWFYTLLCISTMVSNKSSYKNVVCLGHVLDEKGEKMSKSKGNVVNPWDIFQNHGADAIRWYFLTGAPPGNSRRLGKPGTPSDPVNIVHTFMNMLINCLGFFTLYANVDNIQIEEDWENQPIAGAHPFQKRTDMDRWILSYLQDVIQETTTCLENYDCLQAGKHIETFLESLSNWYIRRNRRRFWKGILDQDKLNAYDTLYRCLCTISRLLVPFMPFLAEDVFQILVTKKLAKKSSQQEPSQVPQSVLLSSWPNANHKTSYDKTALSEETIVKDVVFLGRAARMQANIKVRQPLSRIFIFTEKPEIQKIIHQKKNIILEELNVKSLEFMKNSDSFISYKIKPNLPRIGKRLGSRVRIVQRYLQNTNVKNILNELEKENKLSILIPKEEKAHHKKIELEKEDLLIESTSKGNVAGVEGKGLFVVLETDLNENLIAEGLARDVVRNIQEARKSSGFNVTDRIGIYFPKLNSKMSKAVKSFQPYIESETLSKIFSPELFEKVSSSKAFAQKGKNFPVETEIEIEKEKILIALWNNLES